MFEQTFLNSVAERHMLTQTATRCELKPDSSGSGVWCGELEQGQL